MELTPRAPPNPARRESYQYLGAYVSSWSSVMAAAVLASVPAVAPLLVAECFVASGRSDEAVT
jgi:multiple sugar transport system permease protein